MADCLRNCSTFHPSGASQAAHECGFVTIPTELPMRSIRAFALAISLMLSALMPAPVVAQDYPNRPIRIVVPFAPGGAVDLVARVVGQALSERGKQPRSEERRV